MNILDSLRIQLERVIYLRVVSCYIFPGFVFSHPYKENGENTMKKMLLTAVALVVALSTSFALSASENAPLTIVDILQRLDKAGYHQIHEIEYKNGVYEVETYTAQGQKAKLRINAQNPTIPAMEKNAKPYLNMLQVAEKVQAEGYTRIHKIEFEHEHYEVKAYDMEGDKVKLHVDPVSGKVSKEWF